jgi:hypothetical protein
VCDGWDCGAIDVEWRKVQPAFTVEWAVVECKVWTESESRCGTVLRELAVAAKVEQVLVLQMLQQRGACDAVLQLLSPDPVQDGARLHSEAQAAFDRYTWFVIERCLGMSMEPNREPELLRSLPERHPADSILDRCVIPIAVALMVANRCLCC